MVGTIPTYIVYDNVTQCFGERFGEGLTHWGRTLVWGVYGVLRQCGIDTWGRFCETFGWHSPKPGPAVLSRVGATHKQTWACVRSAFGRSASFCTFLTTAWPEPRAVQSIRGEPASAANRQAHASPSYSVFPQDLHDPHIRRVGFRVASNIPPRRRLTLRLGRRAGPLHSRIDKDPFHTVPIY